MLWIWLLIDFTTNHILCPKQRHLCMLDAQANRYSTEHLLQHQRIIPFHHFISQVIIAASTAFATANGLQPARFRAIAFALASKPLAQTPLPCIAFFHTKCQKFAQVHPHEKVLNTVSLQVAWFLDFQRMNEWWMIWICCDLAWNQIWHTESNTNWSARKRQTTSYYTA